MLIVEVNGVPFDTFIEVNVNRAMNRLAQNFSATASYDTFKTFPIKLGDDFRGLTNDKVLITGKIEVVHPRYDSNEKNVFIAGRDKTAPVVKSNLSKEIRVSSDVSLKSLIERILSDLEITDISVIDLVNPSLFKTKDVKINEGENAFEGMSNYAKQVQCLLSANENGDIVIQRASNEIIPKKLISNLDDSDRNNNVLSAEMPFSTENLYKKYVTKAQESNTSILDGIITGPDPGKSFVHIDNFDDFTKSDGFSKKIPAISENSTIVIYSEDAESEEIKNRGIWEASLRRSQAFSYRCKVQGFLFDDENPWIPNRIVNINDEFVDLFGDLLIESVNYNFSELGSIVTLRCVTRSSYSIQSEIDALDQRSNRTGQDIFNFG